MPLLRILLVLAAVGAVAGRPAGASLEPPDRPHAGLQAGAGSAADPRMAWWRDARFGMFIHFGLYAVPAGEWQGRTNFGEWIRNNARIPIDTYDEFRARFNPTGFDAGEWVRLARQAGMKYIVITTKHHDGFCLFDSKETDFDVMSTPFKRDIMKELADACHREGVRLGWYYSIMDWHHPDYLPRRDWETRPTVGADFDRYVRYMKAQLRELLTNYGPIDILWFDGQWEGTWTAERGRDLYNYVRSLRPGIISNNRVGRGDGGSGPDRDPGAVGDFGTPEQTIPPTGLPGVDWETCMTMNDNWGYNRADKNFKPTSELIHMLVDIASKGGNYLLNVGPMADGRFPPESIVRLEGIGRWMQASRESIYATAASPLEAVPWGRVTRKALGPSGTRLYLHVFEWPRDGRLLVPGLLNGTRQAYLLSDPIRRLLVLREGGTLVIEVPAAPPDPIDSVVVLDIDGRPKVVRPQGISGPGLGRQRLPSSGLYRSAGRQDHSDTR